MGQENLQLLSPHQMVLQSSGSATHRIDGASLGEGSLPSPYLPSCLQMAKASIFTTHQSLPSNPEEQ